MNSFVSVFLRKIIKTQNCVAILLFLDFNLIFIPSFSVASVCGYQQLVDNLNCCSVKAVIEEKIEKKRVTKDFDIEKSYYLKIKLPENKKTTVWVKKDLWEVAKKGESVYVVYKNDGKIKEVINKKAEIQDYIFRMVLSGLLSIYLLWTFPAKKILGMRRN